MVPERAAANADGDPGRLGALHEDVRGGVAGLVDRDRLVSSGTYSTLTAVPDSTVVIALDDVVPAEALAAGMGERERHRADLLDHRRAVAQGDPRQLVAALLAIEVLVVRDLRDVEVEDVPAVALVGVRNQTWRPIRPGRVRAGSSAVERTLVAPMK